MRRAEDKIQKAEHGFQAEAVGMLESMNDNHDDLILRTPNPRLRTKHSVLSLVCLLILSACATTPTLPPPPPRYVTPEQQAVDVNAPRAGSNSLWSDTASLYEDVKARRLNDLITIRVVENISGSGAADTAASRSSSLDAGVDSLFGLPLNANLANAFGKGNTFSPTVSGGMENDFKGNGSTNRSGTLVGTITAKVVEVMPNGILAIESRKELTINNEKQILILRGMIRPEDVAVDNSVQSNRVSDAQVYFVGDGVLASKQNTGWLTKLMDKIWPF